VLNKPGAAGREAAAVLLGRIDRLAGDSTGDHQRPLGCQPLAMVYTDSYQEVRMGSAEKGTTRAKLFRNGRSQAVRLPKAFRFKGREVIIHREGDAVILEPIQQRSWPRGYWDRLRELQLDFEVEPMRPELDNVDVEEP